MENSVWNLMEDVLLQEGRSGIKLPSSANLLNHGWLRISNDKLQSWFQTILDEAMTCKKQLSM